MEAQKTSSKYCMTNGIMSFKSFLQDYGKKYIALQVSAGSSAKLTAWAKRLGFDLSIGFNEQPITKFNFHTTVFFSDNETYLRNGLFPIQAIELVPTGWKILGENTPVLLLQKTDQLTNLRRIYENMGLYDKWPEWIPHISVSYNWNGKPATTKLGLPDFKITADSIKVENQKEEDDG